MKAWKMWIKAATVRALKTMAQTTIALTGVGAAMSDIDWVKTISAACVAGILSLLTSVAGLPEVPMAEKEEKEL